MVFIFFQSELIKSQLSPQRLGFSFVDLTNYASSVAIFDLGERRQRPYQHYRKYVTSEVEFLTKSGHFTPRTFHPKEISPHRRFTPRKFHPTYFRTFHHTYISLHGHFTPRTFQFRFLKGSVKIKCEIKAWNYDVKRYLKLNH